MTVSLKVKNRQRYVKWVGLEPTMTYSVVRLEV